MSIEKWDHRKASAAIAEADYYEFPEETNVGSWSPSPPGTPDVIATQVHLRFGKRLVSVENGVESFEEAFLAHLVLPGGGTVGQQALPAVAEAYATGKMPASLLLGDGR